MSNGLLFIVFGGAAGVAALFVLAAYVVERALDKRWKDEGEAP